MKFYNPKWLTERDKEGKHVNFLFTNSLYSILTKFLGFHCYAWIIDNHKKLSSDSRWRLSIIGSIRTHYIDGHFNEQPFEITEESDL